MSFRFGSVLFKYIRIPLSFSIVYFYSEPRDLRSLFYREVFLCLLVLSKVWTLKHTHRLLPTWSDSIVIIIL